MTLSLLNILEDTTVDGPGFRTAIYAAGCGHHCPGCHNPESWDMGGGQETPVADVLERVLADDFADVTFSGGDPMFQPEGFAELAEAIKARTSKTIWCYTGFTYEALLGDERTVRLLRSVDVLVDGRYVESLRDETLLFRGSANQRVIDVPASLKAGRVVLLDLDF